MKKRGDEVHSETTARKMKKRGDEVHSETTARKSQQCEATADLRGLARDAGRQPSENNLDILDILDALEKSSGNLQVSKRATRGPVDALQGSRKSGAEVGMKSAKCKLGYDLEVGNSVRSC
jgi:hypothetical protein